MKVVPLKFILTFVLLLCFLTGQSHGEESKAGTTTSPKDLVTLDMDSFSLDKYLPFDAPFKIKIDTKNKLKKIKFGIADLKKEFKEYRKQNPNLSEKYRDLTEAEKDAFHKHLITKHVQEYSKPTFMDQWIIPIKNTLRPNKRYLILLQYELNIDEKTRNDIKDILAKKVYNFVEQEIEKEENNDFDTIVNKLLDKIPDLIPRRIKGAELVPGKNSIFDKTASIDRKKALEIEAGKIKDIFNLTIDKYRVSDVIKEHNNNRVPELHSLLQRITSGENKSLLLHLESEIARNESLKYLRKDSEFIPVLSKLDDQMLLRIAQGWNHLEATDYSPTKDEKDYNKPSDFEIHIENLTHLSRQLRSIKLVVEYMDNLREHTPKLLSKQFNYKLKEKLKKEAPGLIRDLDASLSKMYTMINELSTGKSSANTLKNGIDQLIVNKLDFLINEYLVLEGSTFGDFKTRASWYISADLGVAWAPEIEEAFPYLGANIYLKSVNKEIPLRLLKEISDYKSLFWHRFSLMVGFSVTSLQKENERDDLFGKQSVLLGAGLRITDAVRLSGGMAFFKSHNPDPLIKEKVIKYAWFISASLDWDVESTLKKIFTLLGGK